MLKRLILLLGFNPHPLDIKIDHGSLISLLKLSQKYVLIYTIWGGAPDLKGTFHLLGIDLVYFRLWLGELIVLRRVLFGDLLEIDMRRILDMADWVYFSHQVVWLWYFDWILLLFWSFLRQPHVALFNLWTHHMLLPECADDRAIIGRGWRDLPQLSLWNCRLVIYLWRLKHLDQIVPDWWSSLCGNNALVFNFYLIQIELLNSLLRVNFVVISGSISSVLCRRPWSWVAPAIWAA